MSQTLYHYTNTAGLIGILTEKKLRATGIGFLSDISEYTTAMSLMSKVLRGMVPRSKLPENKILLRLCDYLIEAHQAEVQGVFVTSFTAEEGNKLSQWRSYCPVGGYSIGFNEDYFCCEKCLYSPRDQKAMLNRALKPYLHTDLIPYIQRNLASFFTDTDSFSKPEMIRFYEYMRALAPRVKHPKYRDEKEWRIIIRREMTDNSVLFRPGKYFPIPYIELDFDLHAIKQIVVGPTPERSVSTRSLLALMARVGLTCEVVYESIPFRSWG